MVVVGGLWGRLKARPLAVSLQSDDCATYPVISTGRASWNPSQVTGTRVHTHTHTHTRVITFTDHTHTLVCFTIVVRT